MLQGRRRDHVAHLQGSDAHSLQAFETHSPNKPWTRIKLTELSFNAFRIALLDPTARVRATASVPRHEPLCPLAPIQKAILPKQPGLTRALAIR